MPTLQRIVLLAILTCVINLTAACCRIDPDNMSKADLSLVRQAVKSNLDLRGSIDSELHGINTIAIAVDRTHDFAKIKVTNQELLEPMTLRLRLAGIKVISWDDPSNQEEIPLLQQSLYTMKWLDGDNVCTVETRLYDDAILLRAMSKRAHVCSWSADPEFDVIPNSKLKQTLSDISKKQIDEFLTAFLKQKGL